jgi:hypothetical protein
MRLMVLVVSLLLPSLLLSVTAGAQVCVPGANAGMRCVSSEGSKSGGRAFWSFDAKEWPLAPGWRCGTGG